MLERLSIKAKIHLLSVITIVITFIVGAVGIFGTVYVNNEYTYMRDTADVRLVSSYGIQQNFAVIQKNLAVFMSLAASGNSTDDVDKLYSEIGEALLNIDEIAGTYRGNLNGDDTVTTENKNRLNNDIDTVTNTVDKEYKTFIDNLYNAFKSGSAREMGISSSDFDEINKQNEVIAEAVTDMVAATAEKKDVMIEQSGTVANAVWIIIACILIIALIAGVIVSGVISKKIVKPLKDIMGVFERVANGDFNVNVRSNGRDECSRILNDFSVVVDNISNLISDIEDAVSKFEKGNINIDLNADKYNGEYKKLMSVIVKMMDGFNEQNRSIVKAVVAYSKGDFGFTSPRFLGDKAVIHESLDDLKDNLKKITSVLSETITDIRDGKLDVHRDSTGFEGDWASIIDGLNELMENIASPIRDTISMLNSMAAADFSKRLNEASYKGEFNVIARTANDCAGNISGYVNEISGVVDRIAHQDISINVSDSFNGDFLEIKESLEVLIQNFNILIKDISASSEQVALGSKSIADSSLNLAQGATEQANAVEELNATVRDIADRTAENAEKSALASNLAIEAQNSADVVNKEMKDMLVAMDEISQASNNISNIIKAIDDIAFQTNILALNAAVEAARAGEHGKGFAVVADEVRTLASRSQQSAKETSDLINTSLEKVEQGTNIANRTAETLKAIINQIIKISDIFSEVAQASEKQKVAMEEVNIGISQISDVVANNTATSEESAAASEELASQSALFRETILKFKLK